MPIIKCASCERPIGHGKTKEKKRCARCERDNKEIPEVEETQTSPENNSNE